MGFHSHSFHSSSLILSFPSFCGHFPIRSPLLPSSSASTTSGAFVGYDYNGMYGNPFFDYYGGYYGNYGAPGAHAYDHSSASYGDSGYPSGSLILMSLYLKNHVFERILVSKLWDTATIILFLFVFDCIAYKGVHWQNYKHLPR